jgi:hypothetical protein
VIDSHRLGVVARLGGIDRTVTTHSAISLSCQGVMDSARVSLWWVSAIVFESQLNTSFSGVHAFSNPAIYYKLSAKTTAWSTGGYKDESVMWRMTHFPVAELARQRMAHLSPHLFSRHPRGNFHGECHQLELAAAPPRRHTRTVQHRRCSMSTSIGLRRSAAGSSAGFRHPSILTTFSKSL